MNWRQGILAAVASPEVLFLLLLGALAGIGAELSHPGAALPGRRRHLLPDPVPLRRADHPRQLGGRAAHPARGCASSRRRPRCIPTGCSPSGGLAAMMLGAFMLVDSPFKEMRVPLRTLVPAALLMGARHVRARAPGHPGPAPPARSPATRRSSDSAGSRTPTSCPRAGSACSANAGAPWPEAARPQRREGDGDRGGGPDAEESGRGVMQGAIIGAFVILSLAASCPSRS